MKYFKRRKKAKDTMKTKKLITVVTAFKKYVSVFRALLLHPSSPFSEEVHRSLRIC